MANNYNSSLQNINTDLQEILNTIKDLPEASNGVELPELNNPATSSDILSGKEAINSEGSIVKGDFTLEEELSTQDNLIVQIQNVINSLPEAGGSSSVETCTVRIIEDMYFFTPVFYYTDGSMEVQTFTGLNGVITVAKNTIVLMTQYENTVSYSSGCTLLWKGADSASGDPAAIFKIGGDAEITLMI